MIDNLLFTCPATRSLSLCFKELSSCLSPKSFPHFPWCTFVSSATIILPTWTFQ